MRKNMGLLLAWVTAALLAIAVSAAAVAGIRGELTDSPTSIGAPSSALTASTPVEIEEGVPEMPETITTRPEAEAVETEDTSTTTTAPPETSTTTTTLSAAPTTTEPTPTSHSKTYDTDGGSVTIKVSGDSVTFAGAHPNTGWSVKLKDPGPEKVKVYFEHEESHDDEDEAEKIEFKAWVEEGELRISTEEED
ncbi:MAG: hypothetical protein ABFR95_08585 [Actinomycetota bacterium]